MKTMGPESSLLSARLAEYQVANVYRGLELARGGSIFVEASQRARPVGGAETRRLDRGGGVWRRLARAMGVGERRRRRAEVMTPISAAPVAAYDPGYRPGRTAGDTVPLAALPMPLRAHR